MLYEQAYVSHLTDDRFLILTVCVLIKSSIQQPDMWNVSLCKFQQTDLHFGLMTTVMTGVWADSRYCCSYL